MQQILTRELNLHYNRIELEFSNQRDEFSKRYYANDGNLEEGMYKDITDIKKAIYCKYRYGEAESCVFSQLAWRWWGD